MKKLYSAFCMVLYLALIFPMAGCSNNSFWEQPLPKADIIFQSTMNKQPYKLGSIGADGSSDQAVNVDENFVKLSWSADGAILYGLSSPRGRWPYEDIGYPAYLNIKEGTFKRCDENLPYYGQIEEYNHSGSQHEVLLYNISEIVTFDLNTCQQTKAIVDFSNRTGEYAISGFSYFPGTQELLYGRYTVPDKAREYRLVKLNLKTGEHVELEPGIDPAWSPDGKTIAYLSLDGLYVMQSNGKLTRRLINRQVFDPTSTGGFALSSPQLRWSPDGNWLLYHECTEKFCEVTQTTVYKVRVSDGMEVKLFTGGKYPVWWP